MTQNSLDKLVAGIVDYAGLFPPAGLDMNTVVQNYADYLASDASWMLARLIVPAARLSEFSEAASGLLPRSKDVRPWKISGLVATFEGDGSAFSDGIAKIGEFNRRHETTENGRACVDVIETRMPAPEVLDKMVNALPGELSAFLEVALDDGLRSNIGAIAELADDFGRSRFFAKIRTGGVRQEMIPLASDVAGFIATCAQFLLPFKATAGLHHPLRGEYRLTYEPDAESGKMFGYLNVFAAACFAFSGHPELALLESILNDDGNGISFTESGLRFQDVEVSAEQVEQIRHKFAFSFGSCSFEEPTTELMAFRSETAL